MATIKVTHEETGKELRIEPEWVDRYKAKGFYPAGESKPDGAGAEGDPIVLDVALESHTVPELRELADKVGVRTTTTMPKGEIVEALRASDKITEPDANA